MIQKLHLHRHITLAALIVGVGSLGVLFSSIVGDLTPLLHVKGLASVAPHIEDSIVLFGTISAVCTAIAAMGHSLTDYFNGNDQQK